MNASHDVTYALEQVDCQAIEGVAEHKMVIVGLTNSGKTLLFNTIANTYAIVANYPHTTITPTRKRISMHNQCLEVIDTPGLHSLTTQDDSVQAVLSILFKEKPDILLVVGDAMRLKPSLLLLAQLLELRMPTLFCLNKMDLAAQHGIIIDINHLRFAIPVPIVESSALHGIGLQNIVEALPGATVPQIVPIQYRPDLEEMLNRVNQFFPVKKRPSRGQILLFLLGDSMMTRMFSEVIQPRVFDKLQALVQAYGQRISWGQLQHSIFNARENWANQVSHAARQQASIHVPGMSYWLGWASRHPILGWPILLGVLWVTFKAVGTLAAGISGQLDHWLFSPMADWISQQVHWSFLNELLVGNYGLLTMGVFNAFGTVLPILITFFLIINLLEDVGYLPNLSVLTTRLFAPVGLSGKAVLPLILGTGCNTMATLTSRMLESRKERLLATFMIALGIPCAVQLGVMLAILASLPFSALLLVLGTVVITQVVTGVLLNRFIPRELGHDFIMELPPFRLPDLRNVLLKTYFRVKWFLVEALPMFVVAAVMMFLLDKSGLLTAIKTGLAPVITGLLSMPDKVTEVFILVLSRREMGAIVFKNLVDQGGLDYIQIVVGLVVMTLFIPCIENTVMMIRELGARWAVSMNLAIITIAILVGGVLNHVLRLV
ncbi:MAG: ferrous iron transporter B [Magnetococcus sp. YQC-5]